MLKTNKWKILISSLVILLPMLAGLLLWDRLPETMTTHWGADGNPDGMMGKTFAIILLPIILLALHIVCLVVTALDKKQANQSRKALNMVFWIMPCLSLFTNGMFYSIALGKVWNIQYLLAVIFGLLFLVMGNYLPKVKQNHTLGIKVFYTLYNEENWNKTHRLAGKLWVVCGIGMLLTVFLPTVWMLAVTFGVLAIAIVIPYAYSYRLYKAHRKAGICYNVPPKTKKQKAGQIISTVIVLLILAGVALLMFTGNINYQLKAAAMTIQADYYDDLTVSYETIDTVTYQENTSPAMRVYGFASARLSIGTFESDDLGRHSRYTYTSCDAVIVLTSKDNVLVINDKTPAQTQALYENLLAKTSKP